MEKDLPLERTVEIVNAKKAGLESKVIPFEHLQRLRSQMPQSRIVHCHGVFDVLHYGHVKYFASAKQHGDILVVTTTVDKHVNKGPGRPHFPENVRAQMLASLEVVDFVALSPYPTAVNAIEALKPDFYVKGPDYQNMGADLTGAIFDEERAAKAGGGKLVFTNDITFSSSTVINKFFTQWTEKQEKIIAEVQSLGGMPRIEEVFARIAEETICIVGEPIVDKYVYCLPESLSSKSPSISAKYLYQESYAGGVLAIANHLSSFVKKVDLVTTCGGEDYFMELLRTKMDERVQIHSHILDGVPTPLKTRFLDKGNSQRFFEVTELQSDQWLKCSPRAFCKDLLEKLSAHKTAVIADFGHGLFESEVLNILGDVRSFVGLNVQTNSSNFGFNPFTKHKRFDFLSIDTREARIACHDRYTPILDLARKISSDLADRASLAVTLGSDGSCYFPKGSQTEYSAPAFTGQVLDATGAGDAFFGLSTLLEKVQCPPAMIPFIGNVFAGLKTQIIGNKASVSKVQLLKAVNSILR